MGKRVLTGAIIIAAAAAAYGGEPGGFRPGLYLGEATAACALSLPFTFVGFALVEGSYGRDDCGYGYWFSEPDSHGPGVALGNSLAFVYPFVATLGTIAVGEGIGSKSSNLGTAYFVPSLASLGVVIATGSAGLYILDDDNKYQRFWRTVFYGIIPNAFFNAFVYNVVKKPADDASSSRFSVTPYAAVSRGGGEATPVYGLTLSF